MEVVQKLVRSRKFWLAVVALAQTLIFASIPNFKTEVWVAIDAVLVVLINAIATEDAAEKSAGVYYEEPVTPEPK
jgi:hypothetical protein